MPKEKKVIVEEIKIKKEKKVKEVKEKKVSASLLENEKIEIPEIETNDEDIIIEEKTEPIFENQFEEIQEEKEELKEENLEQIPLENLQEIPLIFSDKEIENLPEEIQTPKKELSIQAKKWELYLPMHKLSPEDFLIKYPFHNSRKYIEEIIEFKKNNS